MGQDVLPRVGLLSNCAWAAAARMDSVPIFTHVTLLSIESMIIGDFGGDKDSGERSVATATRVKRRFSHQAMHACLGAEPVERVLTLKVNRGAF